MIAYKVTTLDKISNLFVSLLPGLEKTRVIYIEGSLITPVVPNSLLFVFLTEAEGMEYIDNCTNRDLWEVEVDELIMIPAPALIPNDKEVNDFWANPNCLKASESIYKSFGCKSLRVLNLIASSRPVKDLTL